MFVRVADKFQRISRALHFALGTEGTLYPRHRNRDVVVMYHSVLPEEQPHINIRNISQENFRRHLRYYKKRYSVVPLAEMFTATSNTSRLAITFDDGLVNNLRHALPVIEEEALPVTFFVTTSWIRGESTLWPDTLSVLLSYVQRELFFKKERFVRTSPIHFCSEVTGKLLQHSLLREEPAEVEKFIEQLKRSTGIDPAQEKQHEDICRVMTGEEIKLLSQSNWTEIGSHCVSHHHLLQLPLQQVKEELQDSKTYLEKVTGKNISSLAYPFGAYTREMLDMAEAIGYKRQLAVNYLYDADKNDHRVRQRYGLYSDTSFAEQMHSVNTF